MGLQYGTVSSRSASNPGNCTVRNVHLYKLLELTNCVIFSVHCTLTSRYTAHSKIQLSECCTSCKAYCTPHSTQYVVHCKLYIAYPVHCTNYSTHFTIVRFTFILHVYCKMYTVYFTHTITLNNINIKP